MLFAGQNLYLNRSFRELPEVAEGARGDDGEIGGLKLSMGKLRRHGARLTVPALPAKRSFPLLSRGDS